MQFGGGGRLCPGKELGIVEIAIFLHHFVTKYRYCPHRLRLRLQASPWMHAHLGRKHYKTYHAVTPNMIQPHARFSETDQHHCVWFSWCRWEEVGRQKLLKFPRVEAPNGLHIRVSNLLNWHHVQKYNRLTNKCNIITSYLLLQMMNGNKTMNSKKDRLFSLHQVEYQEITAAKHIWSFERVQERLCRIPFG